MEPQKSPGLSFVFAAIVSTLALACGVFVYRRLQIATSQVQQEQRASKPQHEDLSDTAPEPSKIVKRLQAAFPDSVILPQELKRFKAAINQYWQRAACETLPGCIFRPTDTQQLSAAVGILKQIYDSEDVPPDGLFAVRGGGHSSVHYASSISGGILIDMSLFKEVRPSTDRSRVVLGAGTKWIDVYTVLDKCGLAVAGGRNSDVGVSGLILGGGLSFYSPQYGFVCNNVIVYEIVLADGTVVEATETNYPDLWRALKGGSNNFGIVTRFTVRAFPGTKVWSGFLYLPGWKVENKLAAFNKVLARAEGKNSSTGYDKLAAGPLLSFSYIDKLGMTVSAVNMAYVTPDTESSEWPECWNTSGFKSFWGLWNTHRICTLADATDEMNMLNPVGKYQAMATTTIKNDPATLARAYDASTEAIAKIRLHKVDDLVWTILMQPILPDWAKKGDSNPLGLETAKDPLVVVLYCPQWASREHDDFVHELLKEAIDKVDGFAAKHDTGHRFRYLNYCAKWQTPFESYGQENWQFLKDVSKKYDPDGFFQRACPGGFKLDMTSHCKN